MKRNSMNTRVHKRAYNMLVGCFFLFFVLVFVYGYKQIILGSYYYKMAVNQASSEYTITSPRGAIVDRNGRPLATSVLSYSLYVDPNMFNKNPQEVATLIKPYLHVNEAEIIKRMTEKDTAFVWIERQIDKKDYEAIRKIIRDHDIEGLDFKEEYKRYYPNGTILAQVLGFVGTDNNGLSGMEALLEKYIKGNKVFVKLIHDNRGRLILQSTLTDRIPKKQNTAILTIDTTVQFIAEEALAKAMTRSHAVSGSVIVMNAHTGDILAMVNQPSFEPSHYTKYPETTWKNVAVTNNYEPGSTFKPIIAAAALDSGKWKVDEVYDDPGFIQVDDRTIYNWDNEANHRVTLLEILKNSINTGMVQIGLQTGADTLLDYLDKFGFGKPTDIELPGEGSGVLYNKKTILKVNTATMSIGQGITVTPLQMVQAFSTFANNGKMVQPHIIKEIVEPDGKVIKDTKTKIVAEPVSPQVVKDINTILEQEVASGGGINAHLEGYEFCGKTGTAQIPDPEHGGYYEGRHVASFIGYGPLPTPEFVILVVINQPQGVYYGAQVAAPVFKDIVSQLVRYYQLSPTIVHGEKVTSFEPKERIIAVSHTPDGEVIVPDFTGWSMGEVREWIHKANVTFRPQGSGFAVEQNPTGGSVIEPGQSISITFQ